MAALGSRLARSVLLRAVDRLRRGALGQQLGDLLAQFPGFPAAADVVFGAIGPAKREADGAADQLEELAGAILRLHAHEPGDRWSRVPGRANREQFFAGIQGFSE